MTRMDVLLKLVGWWKKRGLKLAQKSKRLADDRWYTSHRPRVLFFENDKLLVERAFHAIRHTSNLVIRMSQPSTVIRYWATSRGVSMEVAQTAGWYGRYSWISPLKPPSVSDGFKSPSNIVRNAKQPLKIFVGQPSFCIYINIYTHA